MSAWTEVRALLPETPEDWSRWILIFEDHGLFGTLQHDTPPSLSAYVPPGEEEVTGRLRTALLEAGAKDVAVSLVHEEDWAESWKQFFKPRLIGERILIRPTWEAATLEEGQIEVVLDPGQAFGTGDHPTTRGCLELLQKIDLADADVADIGCGSGILSVAALKLGARSVVAVDLDQASVSATLENAARNGVEIRAWKGKGFDPVPSGKTYQIVLSNIISAALIGLAQEASHRIAAGGAWVVSGIIEANWTDVAQAAKRAGFKLESSVVEGEWVSAVFRR